MTNTGTTTTGTTTTGSRFEPPGPGRWERDISHTTAAPTRVLRRLATTTMPDAYREVFAEFGGPLDTLDIRFVHGAMYRRIVPLVAADSDRPPPPRPVMWLLLRLHPAFRQRERAARKMWAERPDHRVVAEWHARERHEWIARNRALQAIRPDTLTDTELADHVDRLDEHLVAGWRRHHVLHGSDVGPIGDLLVHGHRWGLTTDELLRLLDGASPATSSATSVAERIAAELRRAGVDPAGVRDLDTVRSVPGAAAVLDEHLEHAGWHIVTSYDIEARTVGELPAALCALIRGGSNGHRAGDEAPATRLRAALRERVPERERTTFDDLVERARAAYGMRDDNGPLTAEWPAGLLRRAFLESAPRLHATGRLHALEHVFELDSPELAALLRNAPAPSADDLAARAATRRAEAELDPPDALGPDHPDPDPSVFPPGIRRTMEIVITALSLLEVDPRAERAPLSGTGIGDRVHRGTARVVSDPDRLDDLVAAMEPGDVLVAPWTAPTFNAVFAIAGAVVVREGGPLCHAAVMARELGIPTVIGCREALDAIADGDTVDVDPLAGEVRVVAAS